MPPRREDFLERLKTTPVRTYDPNPDLLRVAAVRATELTGHPVWDDYLSRLQALLEQARKERDEWTEKCLNAYTEADVRLAQRCVTQFRTEVEVLEKVIALPHTLIAEYHTAHPEKTWSVETSNGTPIA